MKLSDIKIGNAYATKYYRPQGNSFQGMVVAIDIGKFASTTNSEQVRTVHWRTRQVEVGRSWYVPSAEERRRVVVVDLHYQQVKVYSAAALHAELAEDAIRDLCLRHGLHETRVNMEKRLSEQMWVFNEQFAEMLAELTNTTPERNWTERDEPLRMLLRKPEFVENLLRLWLNYCDARGVDINDRSACDVLADFEDVVTGLAQTRQRQKQMIEEAERQTVLAHAQQFEAPLRIEAA
jgi:hypothetical protein